jgi:methylthioribulose-1-phosphate dehydratase
MQAPERCDLTEAQRSAPVFNSAGTFRRVITADRVELADLVRDIHRRGWAPGTGGNFSKLLSRDPFRLLITSSGVDKGLMDEAGLLEVDDQGNPVDGNLRPSAETLLHVAIIQETDAEVVLHTHTVWNTLASLSRGSTYAMQDLEMLKGLRGVETHEHYERVPIFGNSQNMVALAELVRSQLQDDPATHGILLRGHGLYTWGRNIAEARRHLEVLEFLFEVSVRSKSLER